MSSPLIELNNVSTHFKVPRGTLKAVNGVSLNIYRGETLGLVGESGCGKSTLGKTIMRLYKPDAGQVLFAGEDVELQPQKAPGIHAQGTDDLPGPLRSPRSAVHGGRHRRRGHADVHHMNANRKERGAEVMRLLNQVGLNESHIDRFPHEFSGGQRQRIGIARALSVRPELVVCDEPISALDVSIQAQVVNLLINPARDGAVVPVHHAE